MTGNPEARFQFPPCHSLDLILVSREPGVACSNSKNSKLNFLPCSGQLWFLHLNYLFQRFGLAHSFCAVNTAEGNKTDSYFICRKHSVLISLVHHVHVGPHDKHYPGAPNNNLWKIFVRKTIWDLEFSEHWLLNFLLACLSEVTDFYPKKVSYNFREPFFWLKFSIR